MNAWLVVLAVYKFRAQPSLFLINRKRAKYGSRRQYKPSTQ